MTKKKYLPVWTDGLTYDEQHLTYWLAQNIERVNKSYSLLPLRLESNSYCGRSNYCREVQIIEDYFEAGKCRVSCDILPLAYCVAEKAFDSAADEFFKKYPEALNVAFSKLNSNGVYDIKFDIDYSTRLNLFKTILDEKIEEYCVIDEIFEYSENKSEQKFPWAEYNITARLNMKEEDIKFNFSEALCSFGYPYIPEKQVKIKKEDVYRYYFIVSEKIFNLANQHIIYNKNSLKYSEFFEAASNRDLNAIKKFIQNGVDINSIDANGFTAFFSYIYSASDASNLSIDDLKILLSMGANPAIYGAGFDEEPLSYACLTEQMDIIELLLQSGVNPHLYPYIDEAEISETLIERTERWAEGDLNIEVDPSEAQQKIAEMLKSYA